MKLAVSVLLLIVSIATCDGFVSNGLGIARSAVLRTQEGGDAPVIDKYDPDYELNPFFNQTSTGSWCIDAMKRCTGSEWYQADHREELRVTAGNPNDNVFFGAWYFLPKGHYAQEVPAGGEQPDNRTLECGEFLTECDYNCEISGYSAKYMEYIGRFRIDQEGLPGKALPDEERVIDYWGGPAPDAVGILSGFMGITSVDPASSFKTQLYRSLDIAFQLGGLGRYWYYDLVHAPPSSDLTTPGDACPEVTVPLDGPQIPFANPEPPKGLTGELKSQSAWGIYLDMRADTPVEQPAAIFVDQENQKIRLQIGDDQGVMRLILVNASTTVDATIDHTGEKAIATCTSGHTSYAQAQEGLMGVNKAGKQAPMSFVWSGDVLQHRYAPIEKAKRVHLFGGWALLWDHSVSALWKTFDDDGYILGMDIINEGVKDPEQYVRSKTGLRSYYFDPTKTKKGRPDDLGGDLFDAEKLCSGELDHSGGGKKPKKTSPSSNAWMFIVFGLIGILVVAAASRFAYVKMYNSRKGPAHHEELYQDFLENQGGGVNVI